MNNQLQKEYVQKFLKEVIGNWNYDIIDDIFADDSILMTESDIPQSDKFGKHATRERIQLIEQGFPDLVFTINEIVSENDLVMVNYEGLGTHEGFFMGAPPTGKKIHLEVFHMFKFNKEGKIAKSWFQYNSLQVFIQLNLASIENNNSNDLMKYLKQIGRLFSNK